MGRNTNMSEGIRHHSLAVARFLNRPDSAASRYVYYLIALAIISRDNEAKHLILSEWLVKYNTLLAKERNPIQI